MKKQKPLWRISVATLLEAEDAVSELLASHLGVAATAYFDLEQQTSLVSAFVGQGRFSPAAARKVIAAGLERIEQCGLKIGAGKIEIAKVKREDWAESWKRHFHPMEIGDALLVRPSWSKHRARKGQAVVVLDPGLSFGTGQHPTTSFCLHQIVAAVGRPPETALKKSAALCRGAAAEKSFLDIGTGSGILAIAAAKLGFSPVHAFDFDPDSVRVGKANARKNRVDSKMKLTRGDITKQPLKSARQYDLVCANLISNLLIAERRRIVNRLKPGGTLVLAGILAAEFHLVQRAFEDLNLKLTASRVENEWCSGAFSFC